MPRGRFISKEISLDEKVDALSNDTARLLFTWLIPHLDCEGRMHGDATTVKSIVFPRRPMHTRTVEKYLKQMEKLGLILRYSVNGTQISSKEKADVGAQNTYLFAPNFEKHQMGLQKSKEAQSQIPPFTPDLLQSRAKQTPSQVKAKVKAKVEEVYAQVGNFNIFWEAYPKRKSKGQAEKAFEKLNPDEQLFKTILAAIGEAKKSEDWQKDGGQYIPYPATWLSAKGWEDEIKEGGQNGENRRHNGKRGLPKKYRSPGEIFGDRHD